MESQSSRYREIANSLRMEIASQRLGIGSRMPDERTLSEKYAVSRLTMRRALRILEDEKLIRRVQGSGTYINPPGSRKIPLSIDYSGSMRQYAPDLSRKLLLSEIRRPSAETAADMNINDGEEILYAERIDFLKGVPIAYDKAHISLNYGKALGKDELEQVNFIECWTRFAGFSIEYCTQNIEAISSCTESARILRINTGIPLLKSSEHYFLRRGMVAGFFISFYNPEHISIRSQYNWANPIIFSDRTLEGKS